MLARSTTIHFHLIYDEETVFVSCYANEYRNLMALINEKIYVPDFGECKGIGRCGTCLVRIENVQDLPAKDRNEQRTLYKCKQGDESVRLACQLMINELLNGARIYILEDRVDVR